MKKVLFAAILILVFGAGFLASQWWEGSKEPSQASKLEHAMSPDFALSKEDMEKIAQKRELMKAQREAARAETSKTSPAKANKPQEEPAKPEKEIPFEEQYRKTLEAESIMARRLDEILYRESYDEKWAEETKAKVQETCTNAKVGGATVNDTTCRSSFCRVSFSFESTEAKDRFISLITLEEPFNTSGWLHSEGLDDKEVELYFTRRGKDLPKVNEDLDL